VPDLLIEEFVVVTQVVPEQREGPGERAAAGDDLGSVGLCVLRIH
jgi:hypothetical protein